MRKIKVLLAVLGLFVLISVSHAELSSDDRSEKAEEKTKEIKRVIVSASRFEESPDKISSDVTVITEAEMEEQKIRNVIDALRTLPDIQVSQTGAFGGETSIYLRGLSTGHTVVMVDGVRVYDPMSIETSFNAAHVPIHNIERIEILKGPQSVLYGSNALGGVINIITKRGKGTPYVSASGGLGSYRSIKGSVETGGSIDFLDYSMVFSTIYTDGISSAHTENADGERDYYRSNYYSIRVDANVLENVTVGFLNNYNISKFDLDDGSLDDDPNARMTTETLVMMPYIEMFPFDWWKHDISFAFLRAWRMQWDDPDDNDGQEDLHSFYKGYMYKFSYQNSLYIMDFDTLVTGLEYELERGESYYFLYDPAAWWGAVTESTQSMRQNESRSFFLNNVFHKWGLHASCGFRIENHSRAGKNITYRYAGAYTLPYDLPWGLKNCSTKFRVSYGSAVKNPSIYQLYSEYGDDMLKAEESYGVEAGIEQRFLGNKYYGDITFFQNNLNNLISWEPLDKAPWLRYTNIGGAVTKGFTITSVINPVSWLSARLGYTRLSAMDTGEEVPLLRRPKDKFNLGINWQVFNIKKAMFDDEVKGTIDFNLSYAGNRPDKHFDSVTYAPEWKTAKKYAKCDIVFTLDFTKHLQGYFKIENLFDACYEEVWGYNTPGRNWWLGSKLKF